MTDRATRAKEYRRELADRLRAATTPEPTPLVVRAGETRDAYVARMLAERDRQCAAPKGNVVPYASEDLIDRSKAYPRMGDDETREHIDRLTIDTPTVEVPQADVIAFIEANDGNEVSRAMACAWSAQDERP